MRCDTGYKVVGEVVIILINNLPSATDGKIAAMTTLYPLRAIGHFHL